MIQEAINQLVSGENLPKDTAFRVMNEIMSGDTTPAQFGSFVTALRLKGETAEEISGMAIGMRENALRVVSDGRLIDTCGTGGDGSQSINVSTISAFVVAGAGLKVAKHGNRSITSLCGSADVLEAAGVKIELGPNAVEQCIKEIGIGFMFAPIFHPAMRHAAAPRREIGIRTVFNILGPLTNPAGAVSQVLGIADSALGLKMAEVLRLLGSEHALVVHGENGMDELSISGTSTIWELNNGEISEYTVQPTDFDIPLATIDAIKSSNKENNLWVMNQVLKGEVGPARDIVLLNAAAALVAGDLSETMNEGIELAQYSIESGAALAKLHGLVDLSQQLN